MTHSQSFLAALALVVLAAAVYRYYTRPHPADKDKAPELAGMRAAALQSYELGLHQALLEDDALRGRIDAYRAGIARLRGELGYDAAGPSDGAKPAYVDVIRRAAEN